MVGGRVSQAARQVLGGRFDHAPRERLLRGVVGSVEGDFWDVVFFCFVFLEFPSGQDAALCRGFGVVEAFDGYFVYSY